MIAQVDGGIEFCTDSDYAAGRKTHPAHWPPASRPTKKQRRDIRRFRQEYGRFASIEAKLGDLDRISDQLDLVLPAMLAGSSEPDPQGRTDEKPPAP